jgi:hypothetical protein
MAQLEKQYDPFVVASGMIAQMAIEEKSSE